MADSSPKPTEPVPINPNPNPLTPPPAPVPIPVPAPQLIHAPPPPQQQTMPMFRPMPQFSPLPPVPGQYGQQQPMVPGQYGQHPINPGLRPVFAPMPNGFPGMIPNQGIPRYGLPYNPMVRPPFFTRPPGVLGAMPQLMRPPIGIRGPLPPVIRPAVIASITPIEKPQTTVYVGKIASTVQNDFILALLQLCGPVKSWKRAQDPTNGTPKGFGFCEFETAEGVLRAMRLLSKLNIDGLELMINVNQATKEYLERYVEKKAESSKKLKEAENVGDGKVDEGTINAEKSGSPKPSDEESKKDDSDTGGEKKIDTANFGIVSDEEREADRELLEKLTGMIEVRLKNNPLPPPPPLPAADDSNTSNLEQPEESKDSDSNVDDVQNGEVKKDEQISREAKPSSEQDKMDTSSPDRSKRDDRRSRDRERDKRDKERELERYEKEREQDRTRREREREYKNKEDDRRYKQRVKEWESRERDKEYVRKQEKEKEKEREYQRKQDVLDQELEGDDGESKKRKHKSYRAEERKRRMREKEDDIEDRLREEEEVAEAKIREEEELQQLKERELEREKDVSEPLSGDENNGLKEEIKEEAIDMFEDGDSENDNHIDNGILQNGDGDESVTGTISASEQNNNSSSKKLGFGLVGSGKRTAVPSVFNQEEDEDAHKDKKMRPLVPIDYSTEELQAVQSSTPVAPSSNLAAAAEFAKQISGNSSKEDRADGERERSRRSHDRSGHRDRNGDESNRTRDDYRKEERDRDRERRVDKKKTPDNQKLLDAKQLIDMIPKTKDELFSYEINWSVYEKNELHDRMKPWISKKITEFLGEEEPTLVEYIVSSTHEHVTAAEMLDRLQSILDDEAEMFVLKMWRMLIFEIKKIETGLAQRASS